VELQRVVDSSETFPSADLARAYLAKLRFARHSEEEAINLWKTLDESKRREWDLDGTLERTVFLAAVQALKSNQYEQAAKFLREVCLDRKESNCSALLAYALAEAGKGALQRSDYEAAKRFLQEAILNGCDQSMIAYDLARAFKHLGRLSNAREALQKIANPDAVTFFHLGLLSLEEKRLSQAEADFARAWTTNSELYPAAYNLLFTRLSLGKIGETLDLFPIVLERTSNPKDRTVLEILERVLRSSQNGDDQLTPLLDVQISSEEEQRLLQTARGLGHPATATRILQVLTNQKQDGEFQKVFLETLLMQAKQLLDGCNWSEAARVLAPWADKMASAPVPIRTALLNLFGCCACLSQDFEKAVSSFAAALQIAPREPRVSQNLALTYELQGRLSDAESHWNWYLEVLDGRIPTPPNSTGYKDRLTFECLHRLAVRFSEKANWNSALTFLQRAYQIRPDDADTTERLFHLLNQLKKSDEARRVLRRLQHLRPEEPQVEMFELELIELNNLDNCNRVLAGIEALQRKYPNDARLPERQGQLVGGVITYLKRLSRQVSEQLDRAAARVRRLPSFKVDWPEMKYYLRDLRSRMLRVKKTAARCLPLATSEQHRRDLQQMIGHAEQEMDHCRTLV
jgi:Flp pilus assembly protein TadD